MLFVRERRQDSVSGEFQDFQRISQGVLKGFGVGDTAKAYLQSIIEAKSSNYYKSWRSLGYMLRMVSLCESEAEKVARSISFPNSPDQKAALDIAYWEHKYAYLGEKETEWFVCKGKDYAEALAVIIKNPKKNCLECGKQSDLMILRAWLVSLGKAAFNKLLGEKLGNELLKLPLNEKLLQVEDLSEEGRRQGDHMFRPGDRVVYNNPSASGTIWRVENAVCVGWQRDHQGKTDYGQPLFVGPGLFYILGDKKGSLKKLDEAEMKADIWKKTMVWPYYFKKLREEGYSDDDAIDGADILTEQHKVPKDLEKHFEQRALSQVTEPVKEGLIPLPEITLNSVVGRIALLGGRRDLG